MSRVQQDRQVQPGETEPSTLLGCHVVEVGMRQAWPFLTLADPVSGQEIRVFADGAITVSPDDEPMRQDDERLLAALDRVNMMTVDSAEVVDGDLLLRLEDQVVRISGDDNELTTSAPWRIRPQTSGWSRLSGAVEPPRGDLSGGPSVPPRTDFASFCLSVQRGLCGVIPPSLRAVALGWRDGTGLARFVFDDVPGEDEHDVVAEVETEVVADFPEEARFTFTATSRAGGPLGFEPGESWWAYVRGPDASGDAPTVRATSAGSG